MIRLADILVTRREEILQRFERLMRERLPAEGLSRSEIINTLPKFLDELRVRLDRGRQGLAAPVVPCQEVNTAEQHGIQRFHLGFNVAQLVREYSLLRECILEVLEEPDTVRDFSELRVFNHSIDLAMGDAVAHHRGLWEEAQGQAEEERLVLLARERAARAEAEEARALLDALVAAAPVALALLDTGLRYVRTNEMLAAFTGLPMEAHVGKPAAEVLEQRAPSIVPILRSVLDTGVPVRGFELTATPANDPGVPHHWIADFFPVRTREGQVLGVGSLLMDITERKRYEEQLGQTAQFRERFLGVVSHDLRVPLSVITLSANHLLRQETLPERTLKTVQRVTNNAELMARMISDLLDLTRGRLGGGIPITPAPIDLRELCGHVLGGLEVSHPTRVFRLEAEGYFQGWWDPDRLAQLVGNLVKNAVDYSPEGTAITLALHDEGEHVRLEVNNQGEPIPPEKLPELFEPFRRGRQEQGPRRPGLGLGLFIVQQIALAHGGTVEARSTREEGTTFSVRLPRSPPQSTHPSP